MKIELNEIMFLLTEIRKTSIVSQKNSEKSLALQREVSQRQEEAIKRQENAAKTIRRFITGALLIIALIVVFLIKLRMENYRY